MASAGGSMPALLLIHPIGVGLSSRFWRSEAIDNTGLCNPSERRHLKLPRRNL